MSLSYLQHEATPSLPDSVWALEWTTQNRLVSGSVDGHVRIWDDADVTKPLHDLAIHPLAITSLSCTEDGRYSLSASLDGTVSLVDTEEGKELDKLETGKVKPSEGHVELPAYTASINPQGSAWAWGGRSSKIAIKSLSQHSDTNAQPLHSSSSLVDAGKGKFSLDAQFSPDGRSLAVASEQGHVIVIDAETRDIVASYGSHNKAVRSISWSPDSQWLFSGSDDHLIVLYDVRAGSRSSAGGVGEGAVAMLQGHQSWVLKVATGPNSKLLGSGGADSLIKLWDIGQRSCVFTSATEADVWSFAWRPAASEGNSASKQFAAAGDDKAITMYRAAGSV